MTQRRAGDGFYGPNREAIAELYWPFRADHGELIGRHPCEANGLLEGKPVPQPTTRKELVAFLNELAHKVGIERTTLNPKGYLATEESIL
jgi:hypothetical protein